MGGKKEPKQAAPAVPVSYRKEKPRQEMASGDSQRALGAKYFQTRKQTPSGSGAIFGGQKPTLG